MRRIGASRMVRHIAIAGTCLVLAVFVVGAANCDEPVSYQLTISSTGGGAVTAPDEGTFTYPRGAVVQLVATPDEGYEFRGWTGDTGQIANRNSASTTIRMNGGYSIRASFSQEGSGPGPIPEPPPRP